MHILLKNILVQSNAATKEDNGANLGINKNISIIKII